MARKSCCGIKQGSAKAKLLKHSNLIILDEAPMVSKLAFEALDCTMRGLMRFNAENNMDKPFNGEVVVLGGDFRQIISGVSKGNQAKIVMATLNSSKLWKHCKVLTLKQNMRLLSCDEEEEANEIKMFAKWILDMGDGKLGEHNDGESTVPIPTELLLKNNQDPIGEIVASTYPDLKANFGCVDFFKDKAILTPTLESGQTINHYVMFKIPGKVPTLFVELKWGKELKQIV